MVDFDDTKTERRRFSPLSYLLGLSAKGGSLFILTVIVSGLSGIISVAPFYALYRLILLAGGGSGQNGQNRELLRWGAFIAVAGLVYLLVFIASMMLSHLTAFRVLRDIRYSLAKKLLELPLGWFGRKPPDMSGNCLRKTWRKSNSSSPIMFRISSAAWSLP